MIFLNVVMASFSMGLACVVLGWMMSHIVCMVISLWRFVMVFFVYYEIKGLDAFRKLFMNSFRMVCVSCFMLFIYSITGGVYAHIATIIGGVLSVSSSVFATFVYSAYTDGKHMAIVMSVKDVGGVMNEFLGCRKLFSYINILNFILGFFVSIAVFQFVNRVDVVFVFMAVAVVVSESWNFNAFMRNRRAFVRDFVRARIDMYSDYG